MNVLELCLFWQILADLGSMCLLNPRSAAVKYAIKERVENLLGAPRKLKIS
jgi:hypothetical protein